MKNLYNYLTESSNTSIRYEKLFSKTNLLQKDIIENDLKEYNEDYKLPLGVKTPPKIWNDLFHILVARIQPKMKYEEIVEIIKEYFNDDILFETSLDEDSFAYKDSKDIWDKNNQLLVIHLSKPQHRINFTINFK